MTLSEISSKRSILAASAGVGAALGLLRWAAVLAPAGVVVRGAGVRVRRWPRCSRRSRSRSAQSIALPMGSFSPRLEQVGEEEGGGERDQGGAVHHPPNASPNSVRSASTASL